ncbi:replicative DNA helicase [Litorimonas sp.]|uniref:replicative DNA helicase n=1 Tax=Litorimonas sp. TaxID=1892381 RepID=UPI003A84B0ED
MGAALSIVTDETVAPVHSSMAEQALLGAMLHYNELAEGIRVFLTPDDFYSPLHGDIYRIILEGTKRGQPVDIITLNHALRKSEYTDEVGDDYVASLLAEKPHKEAAPQYARIIADCSMRRKTQARVHAFNEKIDEQEDLNANILVSNFADELSLIAKRGVGQSAFVNPAEAGHALLTQEKPAQIPTGWRAVDEMAMLDRQAITLLAGHTSMGKSAVAVDIARRVARMGYRVDFFSMEMNDKQVAARMMSATMAEGSDVNNPRGLAYFKLMRSHGLSDAAKGLAQETLKDLPALNLDCTPGLTVSDIGARLSEDIRPLDLVIVDYVNKVSLDDMNQKMRHDLQIGEVANRLRDMAKARDCAVLLLCQLNRNSVSRDQKAPELSDLKDSAVLEQAADTVLFCHRPEYYLERKISQIEASGEQPTLDDQVALREVKNQLYIICAKQRMGPIGQRQLNAHMHYNYITEQSA